MQRIYQESDSHSKTIYVRYESKQGETANAPIYMPLKATVLKPVGAVKTKIAEYWYENGTTTRLNVAYPKDDGNTLQYVVELDQVWEVVGDANKPQFGPTAVLLLIQMLYLLNKLPIVQPVVTSTSLQLLTTSTNYLQLEH